MDFPFAGFPVAFLIMFDMLQRRRYVERVVVIMVGKVPVEVAFVGVVVIDVFSNVGNGLAVHGVVDSC